MVTEALGVTEVMDAGGLVIAAVLVGVLLVEDESEGSASDEVQPAKSRAAATASAGIAAPRTLERVFTLPSGVRPRQLET